MPTFTSVTLDRFLEPGEAKSLKRNMPTIEKRPPHLSDSSSFSFPPSPHTITLKRQETPVFKNFTQGEGAEVGQNTNGKDVLVPVPVPVLSPRDDVVISYDKYNGKVPNIGLEGTGDSTTSMLVPISQDVDIVSDDFFDPRDSLSVASSVETEEFVGSERIFKPSTPMAEFYDAYEELSEGGSQSSLRDVEAELRERRLSWLMEIEGRKQAEEALDNMKRLWERLAQKLLLEGLTLPSASTIAVEDEKLETDPAEELCQQIRLARAVSTSVGIGAAKAEAAMEFEAIIEFKNFEIARLLQRLHYYETANQEMSLRNQETTDTARRLTQRSKRRQRWFWRTAGASVVAGSVALAWYFLPTATGSPPTDSFHTPEVDSAAGIELPN